MQNSITINDIKKLNKNSGGHFFDDDLDKSFGGEVYDKVWVGTNKPHYVLFVDSILPIQLKTMAEDQRIYKIRVCDTTKGSIWSASELYYFKGYNELNHGFSSKEEAENVAEYLSKNKY